MKDKLIIDEFGTKFWYQNGKFHRLDGPAVEYINGTKLWCQDDKLHRLDGPALEYADGRKSWYVNDELIDCETQKEFESSREYRSWNLKAFA